MVDCVAKVSEYSLDKVPVDVARSMHMKTRLVYAVGDVRAREREILEGSSDAAVE